MQKRDVSPSHILFAFGVRGDAFDREINLNQAFGILLCHLILYCPLPNCPVENSLRLHEVMLDFHDWPPVKLGRVANHTDFGLVRAVENDV